MRAFAWMISLTILALLGLLAFRVFAVPMIRENARRSVNEEQTVTRMSMGGGDVALSKECDAAMPESSKQLEPFFSAFQKDGTYSVFLVELQRKLVWRYDCRRIGGVATVSQPVIQPGMAKPANQQ